MKLGLVAAAAVLLLGQAPALAAQADGAADDDGIVILSVAPRDASVKPVVQSLPLDGGTRTATPAAPADRRVAQNAAAPVVAKE